MYFRQAAIPVFEVRVIRFQGGRNMILNNLLSLPLRFSEFQNYCDIALMHRFFAGCPQKTTSG